MVDNTRALSTQYNAGKLLKFEGNKMARYRRGLLEMYSPIGVIDFE